MTVRNTKLFGKFLVPLLAGRKLRYLEIGVWCGGTSYWVWQNLLMHPASTATLVDPWQDKYGEKHYKMTVDGLAPWKDRCRIFRMTSEEFFCTVPDGTRFDLVLIDGDHSRDAVLLDGRSVLRLAEDKSVVVFDDIDFEEVPVAVADLEPEYAAAGFRRLYTAFHQVAFFRGMEAS